MIGIFLTNPIVRNLIYICISSKKKNLSCMLNTSLNIDGGSRYSIFDSLHHFYGSC